MFNTKCEKYAQYLKKTHLHTEIHLNVDQERVLLQNINVNLKWGGMSVISGCVPN